MTDSPREVQIVLHLRLLLLLGGDAEGLTHAEMARELEVGQRTVERMRAALSDYFDIEPVRDGPTARYRMRRELSPKLTAPTNDELAELEFVIADARKRGQSGMAERLNRLHLKILNAIRQTERMRLAPDVEALNVARLPIIPAGPRVSVPPGVEEACRHAFLTGSVLSFDYRRGEGTVRHRVAPRGMLVGVRSYLVAAPNDWGDPTLFRLDRMSTAKVERDAAWSDADFDLDAFAAQSFGIFQEDTHGIVLRFDQDVADEVRAFNFHPSQALHDLPDGRIEVRFTSGGLLELARHLFTWGGSVEIMAPDALHDVMRDELNAAMARLEQGGSKSCRL